MHDSSLRRQRSSVRPRITLSPDVFEKAELIAARWGLKNARAAVEAVFRCYADEYLYGRSEPHYPGAQPPPLTVPAQPAIAALPACEALDALDDLLAL
ncbi:hypothetical protein IQ241_20365 [Romeria aff. gracilis LEGE 07310]|uniref:Uncharacterized protein n=1 Tax=Vasconcelosia minhoensis LEGE 07310 TaxID=915328 RepID=A0A8J7AXX4_9CYAN|nr:hypothetical protein [Romeria gracilis]MBE9079623.1 hypothetical protein [Romeria aff. gracilis LEGE 07310]